MGFNINNIRALQHADSTSRAKLGEATTESRRAIYNKPGTEFTTSSSYKQFQSNMLKLLGDYQLPPDQANMLAEFGTLPMEQLVRLILIAQKIKAHREVFVQMARTIKTIISLQQNVQVGLKSFLDGLEKILGLDITRLIQQVRQNPAQAKKETSAPQNQPETQVAKQSAASEFEVNMYKEVQQQLSQSGVAGITDSMTEDLKSLLKAVMQAHEKSNSAPLSNGQVTALQEFHQLAAHSIEEFPKKYFIDLFSFAQFKSLGVSLDEYLKLSSEVSPLRLLNLLLVAQKMGQTTQTLIGSLLSTLQSGGSIADALSNLEYKYAIPGPLQNKIAQENTVSMTQREIQMKEGEHLVLSLLGFDSNYGIIPAQKFSYVLFPQKYEYTGQTLNLSFLPMGVYMIMATAYDHNNNLINYWMKVIVKERTQKAVQKSFDDFKKKLEQDKKKQNQNQNQQEKQERPHSKEPISMQFEEQPENFKGPFLGEVVLPLDYLQKHADDLIIMSPQNNIIIDPQTYYQQNFPNNAIAFRFLVNHANLPNPIRRHGLLEINNSRVFSHYNQGLIKFVKNPASEIEEWKKTLSNFFDSLKSFFPEGEKSFSLAHDFFLNESEAFAKGEQNQEIFSNTSLENKDDRFMAAFYSKGAYAMARAGDVCGALQGLTFASMMDTDDKNQQAVLGEYLEDIKKRYFSGQQDEHHQNSYDVHLRHHLNTKLLGNPFYQTQGEQFVQSVNLKLPQKEKEDKPEKVSSTYRYNPYENSQI